MVLGTGQPVRGQSDRVRIYIRGRHPSIYAFNRLAHKIKTGWKVSFLADNFLWILVHLFLPLPFYPWRQYALVGVWLRAEPRRLRGDCNIPKGTS